MQRILLPHLSVRRLNRLLSSGLITSEQLYRYCFALAVAGEEQWSLNAFERFVPFEDALAQARVSDERRRQGKCLSVLDGIPISIKANIAVESLPLTAGSGILGATTPQSSTSTLSSPSSSSCPPPPVAYNAAVSEALLVQSGCVLLGQTTMDEFGMGSLGTNTVGKKATKNPLPFLKGFKLNRNQSKNNPSLFSDAEVANVISLPAEAIWEAHASSCRAREEDFVAADSCHYSAGGSSCGGAASVAHGSSILSIGTDTGGSVRLPAAWCGVVGWKPSYGVLSRHGLVSYASSLDTVGFLTPTADCAWLAFRQVLQTQKTHQDSTISHYSTMLADSLSDVEMAAVRRDQASSSTGTARSHENLLPLEGFKIGIPAAFSVSECPSLVRDVWSQTAQRLQQLGATVEVVSVDRISPQVVQRSLAAYYLLACAEASSNLARYDGFRYGVAASSSSSSSSSSLIGNVSTHDDDDDDDHKDDTQQLQLQQEWSALERQYAASRTQGFGSEVVRRILCGTFVLSSDKFHTYYEAAAKLRAELTEQLHQALTSEKVVKIAALVGRTGNKEDSSTSTTGTSTSSSFSSSQYDLLLIPTAVTSPVPLRAVESEQGDDDDAADNISEVMGGARVDPTAMLANDVMTVAISLAGLPALAIPCPPRSNGPTENDHENETKRKSTDDDGTLLFQPSLQLIGARHGEAKVLRVAMALEEEVV